ncbi:alpha/beta hydrolase fold protein [Sutterella sp. CAG:397]|nr:alpha/beta hydrolase fold protein [Sutterella sp. CAG:397]
MREDISAMPILTPDYKAPKWLPGAHLQTVIPARFFPRPEIHYRRELIDMPDGDFMIFDWATPEPSDLTAPLLVHFHGLEGSSESHYAEALMRYAADKGWRGVVAHFRCCGGLPNRLPRAYFAGDTADNSWALKTVAARYPEAPLYAVGVSLGGNQLSKCLGDLGSDASFLTAAVSVGAPVDLVAGSEIVSLGANKLYAEMFLSTLKEKVLEKARRFPDLIDENVVKNCSTLYDFDSIYTAPIHGFKSAMDYWTRCSAKPVLTGVKVPLLMLNAKNDPFLPVWALPGEKDVSSDVYLEQPEEGGHIGFPRGNPPGDLFYLPEHIFTFFSGFTPHANNVGVTEAKAKPEGTLTRLAGKWFRKG